MAKPRALVLTGYGINCDDETKFAFEKAGASGELVHINDLINQSRKLSDYQILVFPGGFSYGDDTGAGNALANKIRNNLWEELKSFVEEDKLVLGICNGFQAIANLGLLPAFDGNYGETKVALVHNESPRYLDRWVDLEFSGKSPWVAGIGRMSLPIAHGEGKFYADENALKELNKRGMVSARYVEGGICRHQNLPSNPNGSLENIAAISDETGKSLGIMPHPERAISFTHLPNWTLLKEQYKRQGIEIPTEAPGMQIFKNGVSYFN